jgi:hypothetical protein
MPLSIVSVLSLITISGLLLASPVSAADAMTVVEISGTQTTGELKSWTDERLIVDGSPQKEIARTNIRTVSFADRTGKPAPKNSLIWLANGDRLAAKPVSTKGDLLTIAWPVLGSTDPPSISLAKVAAMIFEQPDTNAEQLRLFADLQTLPPGSDIVLLTNGDRSQGEFEKLDAAFVDLTVAKSTLKLDRSRVRAIRLNPELINTTRTLGRRMLLSLTDGSRLTATRMKSTDNALVFHSPELGEVKLMPNSIVSCQFFGEKIVPLTDYEPAKVEFMPYLSATWPLVRNASVLHGPLMIRGTEFITGLGMHSRMAVTYNLTGKEREFQSDVGIDDAADGAGSVVFGIDVDGRRAWTSSEINGRSPIVTIPPIKLQGSKRLTLLVDFGQFADVRDYADWCDAVFVLDQPR